MHCFMSQCSTAVASVRVEVVGLAAQGDLSALRGETALTNVKGFEVRCLPNFDSFCSVIADKGSRDPLAHAGSSQDMPEKICGLKHIEPPTQLDQAKPLGDKHDDLKKGLEPKRSRT